MAGGDTSEIQRQLDRMTKGKEEPKTVGDRIKGNMKEHAESLKDTRDNFLVWLLSTVTGWLVILSVVAVIALWIMWGFGSAIGTVAGIWLIYGLYKMFS